MSTISTIDMDPSEVCCGAVQLLPGGRWLLVGSGNGTIYYYDLDELPGDLKPKVLVPTALPHNFVPMRETALKLGVDLTTGESPSYHLSEFNLAVVACYGSPELDTSINVWRIEVVFDHETDSQGVTRSRATGLKVAENLSTFSEERVLALYHCSLRGKALAYSITTSLGTLTCVVIVDWTQANGKTKDEGIQRSYIPSIKAMRVYFLPHGRVLTFGGSFKCLVRLYNWVSDCPVSAAPPSQQRLSKIPPTWLHRPKSLYSDAIQPPSYIHGEIRFVITALSGDVFGLSLPIDPQMDKQIELKQIGSGHWGMSASHLSFGYHRMVGLCFLPSTFDTAQYSWPDEIHAPLVRPFNLKTVYYTACERGFGNPTRLLFDQFSHRTIILDDSLNHCIDIHVQMTTE